MCKHTKTITYKESFYNDGAEEPNTSNHLQDFKITECVNCEEMLKMELITKTMTQITLTLTFIPFEEQTPELGKTIVCLREVGENGSIEIETCETTGSFMAFREWNSYTHWCYLPIIET